MTNRLIPISEYLRPVALKVVTEYFPNTPRLGTKGEAVVGMANAPNDFAVLRMMTPEEYQRFCDAASQLAKYRSARQVIKIAIMNAKDFEKSLAEIEASYSTEKDVNRVWLSELASVMNQRILNFLSSMRTYLDHTETRLKRKSGETSQQVKEFKLATAKEFDGHFAYRFVYKLRNYTQHCGMPLGKIAGMSNRINHRSNDTVQNTMDFYFTKSELLSNFDGWGDLVKSEIEALPEDFPLRGYLIEATESLRRIEDVVKNNDKADVQASLNVLSDFLDEIGETKAVPCVYTRLEFTSDSENWKMDFDFTVFPVDLMAELATS
jgi:hypothetical protein